MNEETDEDQDDLSKLSASITGLAKEAPSVDRSERAVALLKQLTDLPTPCPPHLLSVLLTLLTDPTTLLAEDRDRQVMLLESDTAMDLLDCLEKSVVTQACLGPGARGSVVLIRSHCLNTMLVQEDWEWFFGETSSYVSWVVENSEEVLQASQTHQVETTRQLAAQSLLAFLPTLQIREVKEKMALVLQYAFVNLLNTALVLLQDEDPDVRGTVVRFASGLPRQPKYNLPTHPAISPDLAIRATVMFGLDQLEQVVELFSPVVSTLVSPPTLTLDHLQKTRGSSSLFKRGDGVNVYSEETYLLALYHSCLAHHLSLSPALQLSLDLDTVLDMSRDLISSLQDTKDLTYGPATSESGLCTVVSVYCLLDLLVRFRVTTRPLTEHQVEEVTRLRVKLGELSLCQNFIK